VCACKFLSHMDVGVGVYVCVCTCASLYVSVRACMRLRACMRVCRGGVCLYVFSYQKPCVSVFLRVFDYLPVNLWLYVCSTRYSVEEAHRGGC
jgi:hypothetical protein